MIWNDPSLHQFTVDCFFTTEPTMRKTILVAVCVAALSAFTAAGASAQTTGPAAQDSMKKDGMETTGMTKDGMAKDSKSKEGMKKDGMAKDTMSKDAMKKDGMTK